jgi:hypothetical protein
MFSIGLLIRNFQNFSIHANQTPQIRANFLKPKPLTKRPQAHGGLDSTARTLAWVLARLRLIVPGPPGSGKIRRSFFSCRHRGKHQKPDSEKIHERRREINVSSIGLD